MTDWWTFRKVGHAIVWTHLLVGLIFPELVVELGDIWLWSAQCTLFYCRHGDIPMVLLRFMVGVNCCDCWCGCCCVP